MLNNYNKVIEMNREGFNCEGAYIPRNIETDYIKFKIYNRDGDYYYAKKMESITDEDMVIYELIGSYLAKQIGLDAVDYKVGMLGDEIYVLSALFYDRSFVYSYVDNCYFNEDLNKLRKDYFIDNLPNDYPYVRDNILKLSLLDIKMGQYDRYVPTNLMIKKAVITDYVDLAPVYDFGFSYPKPIPENIEAFEIYYNAFLKIRKNEESIKLLLKKYPQARNTIKTLAYLDMRDILAAISKDNDIFIDRDLMYYLISQDNNNSVILKRSL